MAGLRASSEADLKALGEQRVNAQACLATRLASLRFACLRAHREGMQKKRVCELAGIGRPTLDDWISKEQR